MKRNDWTFERRSDELLDAARERCEYHLGRMAFWEVQRVAANREIGDSGLQIRERAQTGGARHEIVIDPTLAGRLSECEHKIAAHRSSSDEYAQWCSALRMAEGRSFTLDFADWMFFFGLIGDEDE